MSDRGSDTLTAQRLATARKLLDKFNLTNWEVAFADLSRVPSRNLTGASFGADGICDFWDRRVLIDPRLMNHRNRFLSVVRHEIAHAILGRPGHGRDWLRVAKRAGCSKKSLAVYRMQLQ